jgi:hypothetical protein
MAVVEHQKYHASPDTSTSTVSKQLEGRGFLLLMEQLLKFKLLSAFDYRPLILT